MPPPPSPPPPSPPPPPPAGELMVLLFLLGRCSRQLLQAQQFLHRHDFACLPAWQQRNIEIHKYKYTNTQIHKEKYTNINTLVNSCCTGLPGLTAEQFLQQNIIKHKYTKTQMEIYKHKYTNTQMKVYKYEYTSNGTYSWGHLVVPNTEELTVVQV